MATLDYAAETEALRQRSPFSSRVVLIAVCLGTVIIVLCIVGIVQVEDAINMSRNVAIMLMSALILITAAFMFAFYKRAKILIDRGVIVQAKVEGAVQIRQNVRLKVSFNHAGKDITLPIYVPSGLAREVQSCGWLWLVIDPQAPKRATPLWEYAGMKNLFEVAGGNRGILDPM